MSQSSKGSPWKLGKMEHSPLPTTCSQCQSIASIVWSDLDESKVPAAFGCNFRLKDVRSCFNSLQENLKRSVWCTGEWTGRSLWQTIWRVWQSHQRDLYMLWAQHRHFVEVKDQDLIELHSSWDCHSFRWNCSHRPSGRWTISTPRQRWLRALCARDPILSRSCPRISRISTTSDRTSHGTGMQSYGLVRCWTKQSYNGEDTVAKCGKVWQTSKRKNEASVTRSTKRILFQGFT